MNRNLISFLLIVIGVVLIVFVVINFETEEMNFWGGALSLYIGVGLLLYKDSGKSSMIGIRFRMTQTGIIALIVGIASLISYFSQSK